MHQLPTLALFLILLTPPAQAQPCPQQAFTPPEQVRINKDAALIVTHPSTRFDGRMASKLGMDAAVRVAKEKHIPVIYLQDDGPNQDYFFGDCHPDYWLYSGGGEINIPQMPAHVYTVGGHWELCQSSTLHDVMYAWAKQPAQNLTITTYMDGVYMKGSLSFQESDPYYADYQKFMGIVNYDRGGEAFSNKLTLLEAMGIIIKEERQTEFLIRSLPHYERTLPDHRVEFRLNGSPVRVLQQGKGTRPPVLLFEFKSSANESAFSSPQF